MVVIRMQPIIFAVFAWAREGLGPFHKGIIVSARMVAIDLGGTFIQAKFKLTKLE